MEKRYDIFSDNGVKNIEAYNKKIKSKIDAGETALKKLPYIVVLIDELADLILVANKELEDSIIKITQMSRAAGIHLVVATQMFSSNVLTKSVIKNIPSRIALAVTSSLDSKIILDDVGAEKLKGNGDMLFKQRITDSPIRIQGVFVSEKEISRVVDFIIKQQKVQYDETFLASYNLKDDQYDDPLYNEIVDFVIKSGKTSASLLQRKYKLGYNRVARMIDLLEERGIIGPPSGSKPREVLVEYEDE